MARPDELTFAPLGGVGEIGMNLSIYGLGKDRQRAWLACKRSRRLRQRSEAENRHANFQVVPNRLGTHRPRCTRNRGYFQANTGCSRSATRVVRPPSTSRNW